MGQKVRWMKTSCFGSIQIRQISIRRESQQQSQQYTNTLSLTLSAASRVTDKNTVAPRAFLYVAQRSNAPLSHVALTLFSLFFFHSRLDHYNACDWEIHVLGLTKFFSGGNKVACSSMECCLLIAVTGIAHLRHSEVIWLCLYQCVIQFESQIFGDLKFSKRTPKGKSFNNFKNNKSSQFLKTYSLFEWYLTLT